MQKLGLQYSGGTTPAERQRNAVVQFYRGVALLWAGYPSDAAAGARDGEEARPRHDDPGPGRQPAPPELLPADVGPGYPVVRPARGRTRCSAGGRCCRRRATRSRAERLYQRAARQNPNDVEALVAAAVGLVRRGQPRPGVLAPRPARAALPAEPDRPLLPRAALRLDGAGAPRRSSSSSYDGRSGPKTVLGKQADQFLARLWARSRLAARPSAVRFHW